MCTRNWSSKNNVIVGITLVNCIDRAGILFNLMKNQVNVKKFKQDLLRDDFGWAVLPVASSKKNECGAIMDQNDRKIINPFGDDKDFSACGIFRQ